MPATRVLLFDLGGVLVDFAGFSELGALCPLGESEIRARWLDSPAVRAFERGALTPQEFARRFVAEWHLALAPEHLLAEFIRWNRGLYPGAERLLRRLRASHRVACLSNSNESHWAAWPELPGLFDDAFLSHQLSAVKPDAEIFERAIERLGVDPAAILYFDDSAPNVEAARRAGMAAHQVAGLAALERRLAALGLTPGSTAGAADAAAPANRS